ncbi:malto-oligosyltrehalose synthase [Microbacterium sp. STN6]|uniref:malto-oligosyltrehalose synthase n=1 Tax=Microbacterium sp. STN6 TaxID=2995588 RepID=UPI0022610100|nr:malto-oligosyltrehalose synthase [Microbacterium sp. STN6]MCX7521667.1 malto-oligosyltrehalose synthase [Microbacterium sp. STN6]
MNVPASTYRLQVRADFDLNEAAALVDYLHELGIDWLYLSPLLQSEPGSDHGYDVVDPMRVDAARGGRHALVALARTAHDAGLGVLVDIVPNHMGVASPPLNAWWWDVLAHGRAAAHADAFDIDWDAGGGKLVIPVLADGDAMADLHIADGMLCYFENRYPIAEGTLGDGEARSVHERQHYRLVNWRTADTDLNYRRFFAVNTLAAIRVEEPSVFDAAHGEILSWLRDGLVDGLRVDHPDGLADPRGYLRRLAEATGGAYVLVEKILEHGERLDSGWATAGTTGYDALGQVDRLFVDPAGRPGLDALAGGIGTPAHWNRLVHDCKRAIADGILGSEVRRLARELGADDELTRDCIAELLACFPVYRSYLPNGAEHLGRAHEAAVARRPDLAQAIGRIAEVLADASHPAAVRFQQTSGMVMAKGVEDTAFYRYTRLTSLTEVGGDPSVFSISPDDFHAAQRERLDTWPGSMTTLSTHDTKRGEDVRARISVLAELPDEWAAALGELRTLAPLGDGPLENLLWQAVIGSRPATRERLHAFAEKAAREAADSTGWASPDAEFEERMHALIDAAFDDPRVRAVLDRVSALVTAPGFSNSLGAKLVQLTAPGVPDVYQGSELWELSLVDPDNRRPVDFGERRRILAEIRAGAHPSVDAGGAAKMLVTHRALCLRRDRPDLFTGYRPVAARGHAAPHAVAFDRGGAITLVTRLPVGLERDGGWGDTVLQAPRGSYLDVLSGRRHQADDGLGIGEILTRYPLALLVREDS